MHPREPRPTVDPDDPRAGRFEGLGADNACDDDGDCLPSGCSGEICAAEALDSTCEAIAPAGGTCGCIAGTCIWYTLQCDCADTDADGVCDGEDSECNADGSPLACRRVAPNCPPGTVPEVRAGCYTDRCVTWADCGGEGPADCGNDAECAPGEACVDGRCVPAQCERAATFAPGDPQHDRYEAPELDNACAGDADCFAGGCGGELCTAEADAISDCDRVAPGGAACGCVTGTCIWYAPVCAGSADCAGLCVESDVP